jgi:hypothetical protein
MPGNLHGSNLLSPLVTLSTPARSSLSPRIFFRCTFLLSERKIINSPIFELSVTNALKQKAQAQCNKQQQKELTAGLSVPVSRHLS